MNSGRVLLIDADPASLEYLAYEIGNVGHRVFTASSGKEGLISAWRDRPDTIIVDPRLPDIALTELVRKLRDDRRTARTGLIAFSSLSSPQEIQAAVDLQFDHYLAKEADAFPELLALIGGGQTPAAENAKPPAPSRLPVTGRLYDGKVIVFISAKGGTGCSSLCANMASIIAQAKPESSVAVLDLVLPIGSIAPITGYSGPLNLVEAAYMSAAESTVEYFQNSLPEQKTWGFRLLAGSPDPQEANDINITRVPVILNNLQKAFDYVFIDIGRSLSANISLPIIVKADQAVLILGPDESTVALTKVIWRYLQSKGMKKFQLYPLINRAVGLEGLTKSEIEAELDITIPSSIPYAGGSFTMANNQNVPLSFRFPDDVATMAIRQTALEIETRAREVKEQRVRV